VSLGSSAHHINRTHEGRAVERNTNGVNCCEEHPTCRSNVAYGRLDTLKRPYSRQLCVHHSSKQNLSAWSSKLIKGSWASHIFSEAYLFILSLDSSVSTVTRLRAGLAGLDCREGQRFVFFTAASRTVPGPTQPCIEWTPRVKRPSREEPRLRMGGAIPPLHQHLFTV